METEKTELIQKEKYKLNIFKLFKITALSLSCVLCVTIVFNNYKINVNLNNNSVRDEGVNTHSIKSSASSFWPKDGGPIVTLSSGRIKGKILESRGGRQFNAFYQIPYAAPPTGQFKFQPPRPFTSNWKGIRDATIQGTKETSCMQLKGDHIEGQTDCLYLSVFTPKLPQRLRRKPNLPVMFYILGGAYRFGRANRYGADYIMDEDVVLVLVEFRVGNFGSLNTEDGVIGGNQGFKDQVLALQWVQKEISKFGGDKKRVLIFGNSSGATSCHAHIVSPMSRGLFSTAVSQSGTVVPLPGRVKEPWDSAIELGQRLNCSVVNSTALHDCLLSKNDLEIVGIKLENFQFLTKDGVPPNGDRSQIFMPDWPVNLLKSGQFQKIPWILGSNSAESYSFANDILKEPEMVTALNSNWTVVAPSLFDFHERTKGENGSDMREAANSLRSFYFGSKVINNDTRVNLTNLKSDTEWVHSTTVAARYYAKFGGKAYYYWLTKEPIRSYGESSKGGYEAPWGVAHADEVQFFFPFDPNPYIGKNSTDYNFSKNIIKLWVQFAETGKPNVRGWEAVDSNFDNSKWLELNDKFSLMNPLTERMKFLDGFPFDFPKYLNS